MTGPVPGAVHHLPDPGTYRGHFAKLVPGAQVVEVFAFETDDDAVRGAMILEDRNPQTT
nr:hypothetical protein [Streptomyces cellostaticus]